LTFGFEIFVQVICYFGDRVMLSLVAYIWLSMNDIILYDCKLTYNGYS